MNKLVNLLLSLVVIVITIDAVPVNPELFLSFDGNLNGGMNTAHSGVINGTPNYVEGIENQAISFSGSGDRQVINFNDYSLKINSQRDFSLQIWVKTTQSSASNNSFLGTKDFVPGFASKERDDGLVLFTNSGTLGFNFGANYTRLTYLRDNGSFYQINDGNWHQISLTFDCSIKTMKLYFDGKHLASYLVEKMGEFSLNESLVLGADGDGLSEESWKRFDGALDNFGIWSRLLTQSEVEESYREFYNFNSVILEDSLSELRVAVWNTEEGGLVPKGYDGRVRIAEILKELDVDIALIQENYSSGDMVSAHLGYYFGVSADSDYLNQGANIAIHSRYPIEQLYGIGDLAFRHLGSKIPISNTQEIYIGSNWYKASEGAANIDDLFQFHKDRMLEKDSIPFLWGGDYNEESPVDGKSGESHTKMTNGGFTDVYRTLFPDVASNPGYTHQNTRIDYLYQLGDGLTPTKAQIIDQWDGGFPSDHNLLIFDFDVHYKTYEDKQVASKIMVKKNYPKVKISGTDIVISGNKCELQIYNLKGQLSYKINRNSIDGIIHISQKEFTQSYAKGVYVIVGTVDNQNFKQTIRLGV